MQIIIGILVVLVLLAAGLFALFKYKNRQPTPDLYELFLKQDTTPVGKVGVFVTGLIMPENHNHAFFHNIIKKINKVVIPWPINILAMKDNGIALLDPHNTHAREKFTPTHLEDAFGNDCDRDGVPYIELYKEGKIEWRPPSSRIYLDHGYFLYPDRLSGEPTLCGKVGNKSRLYYYGHGIKQGKLPHWQQTNDMLENGFKKIQEKYDNVVCGWETGLIYWNMRKKLFEILDQGVDTLIASSPMGIYSHFEDFNSSFRHIFEYVEEWEKEHPGKKIKVIMAPQMGDYQPLRQAFLEMLKDRLDTFPEGSSVMVGVTCHGMPWDAFKWEAWLKQAPIYRDTLFEEVKELVAKYNFSKTNVVVCQDEFADPIWDPNEKYLGTNRAYWNAIKEGYDYCVGLPIEFFAENSDTLMHHAMKNYQGFDDYDIGEPIDYPDWSVPYVRQFKQNNTTVIYNGVPVGKYQKYVTEAFVQSLDSVLSKRAN